MKLYTSFLFISIYISICNMEMCKYSNSVISCDDFSTTPRYFWYCDILMGINDRFNTKRNKKLH